MILQSNPSCHWSPAKLDFAELRLLLWAFAGKAREKWKFFRGSKFNSNFGGGASSRCQCGQSRLRQAYNKTPSFDQIRFLFSNKQEGQYLCCQ